MIGLGHGSEGWYGVKSRRGMGLPPARLMPFRNLTQFLPDQHTYLVEFGIVCSTNFMGHFPQRLKALIVLLAMATMVACQGFSTKSNTQTQPPGALTAAPANVAFGNVQIGTSQSQSNTLTNTGGSSLTITQATVTGTGYSSTGLTLPLTLAAGQSTTFNVVFKPTSGGSAVGNLALTYSTSSTPLNIGLAATAVAGGTLTGSPTSMSFGNVQVGLNQSQTETLKNTGSQNLTVSKATFSSSGFSATGLTLPLTLVPNQSTTFAVVFAPTTAGAANSTLSLTESDSTTTFDVALSGTGVAPATLTATPASMTFTNVQTGQSQTQTETVKNTGGMNAKISLATVSPAAFSISGLTTPLTLAPGQSASFTVTFAPQSAGNSSGNVMVDSDAADPALSVGLTGSAVAPTPGTLNVSSVNVGSVLVGTSGTKTGTLSATGATVTVSSVSVSGANASEFAISGLTFPVTVTTSTPVTFTVKFSPTSSGAATATASFASTATNTPTAATLTGTGTATPATLTATPASMTFTNVQTGQSQTQTEIVKNTGGTDAHISQATVAPAAFSISGLTTPLTLTPGQSASFSVTFAPLSAGNSSGSVMIDSDATNPALSVGLTGSAVSPSPGTLNVSAVNVGSVIVGLSGTQTGTLTATGASVSVSSVSLSGADPSEFSISGLTFPVTVTTSTPVTFTVKFTPTSSGASSATASFASTATNTPTAGALSGTGTPAPVHTVLLSWTGSTTSGITSYNVYRALYGTSSCGTYSNIGSTASTVTQFTDSVVTDGKTYCYATTAVDANGESAYSNITQAVIPAP